MQSGDHVVARFDEYDCVYRIIEHKTTSKTDDIFKYRLMECVCGGGSPSGFSNKSGGHATAMRLKWDSDTDSWSDDYQIKLYPGLGCNEAVWGVSGLCGWGKIVNGSTPYITGDCGTDCTYACDPSSPGYQSYHSPTGSGGAQIITMEQVAEYIEFTTTENVGCITDTCFPAAIRSRGALATVNNYWNGKNPIENCSSSNIAIYFGKNIQEDVSCLRGYGDCDNDPLYTWKGVAVLDKQATSDTLCSSEGCLDDEYCCNLVYRVVDADIPMRATNICCTGDVSMDASPFYEIITRTGISSRINPSNTCQLLLDSSLKVVDTNSCYPPSGYTRAPLNQLLPFEALSFGGGLWLTKAVGDASLGLSGCPDGVDDQCAWHVQAGFKPVNNWESCKKTGVLTDNGTRFINVVDFQGGLKAYDGPNNCDLLVRAGIRPYNDNIKCIENPSYSNPANDIYHEIEFTRGIKVKDDNPDDCKVLVGAGTELYMAPGCVPSTGTPTAAQLKNRFFLKDGFAARDTSDPCAVEIGAGIYFQDAGAVCISGSPVSTRLKNKIGLGKGLWAQDAADNCSVTLGAGFEIGGSTTCVTSSDTSTQPHNKLVAAEGLEIKHLSDCTAEIGLYFNVGGIKSNKITLGNCLQAVSQGSCSTQIKLAESYGDGTNFVQQQFISGLSIACCETGGGIHKITYTTSTMEFNSCGQLTNITAGGSGTLTCPCPSGSGV